MSLKAGLALLKAELGKVWARPILEITVALMAVMATYLVQPITQVVGHTAFTVTLESVVIKNVSTVVSSLMLPLVVMCAVLMSLSFARDYESGLMQSILSAPVSRKMLFTVKFFAVVLPLALLTWIFTHIFCRSYFLFKSLGCFTVFLVCSTCCILVLDALRKHRRFSCFNGKTYNSSSPDSISCKLCPLVPNNNSY